jgi:D-alanyl-D-alanine carboxypeptidase
MATSFLPRPVGHYTDAVQFHPSLFAESPPPTRPPSPSQSSSRPSTSFDPRRASSTAGPVSTILPPKVTCTSFAVSDAATGEVLLGKGAHFPCQIASITKVMTAHVVLKLVRDEAKKAGLTIQDPATARSDAPLGGSGGLLDELVLISAEASSIQGTTAELRTGEVYTVRDMLYGMMLPSGNDAACALAEYVGDMFPLPISNSPYPSRTRDHPHMRFVAEMNREAARLGLTQTRFGNPHGLSDSKQQSSAADVGKLAAITLRDPLFQAIVSTRNYAANVRVIPEKLSRVGKWSVHPAAKRTYPCMVCWTNTNVLLGSTIRAAVEGVTTCPLKETRSDSILISKTSVLRPRPPMSSSRAGVLSRSASTEGGGTDVDSPSDDGTTVASGFQSIRSGTGPDSLHRSSVTKSGLRDTGVILPSLPSATSLTAPRPGLPPLYKQASSGSLSVFPTDSRAASPLRSSFALSPSPEPTEDHTSAVPRRAPSQQRTGRSGSRSRKRTSNARKSVAKSPSPAPESLPPISAQPISDDPEVGLAITTSPIRIPRSLSKDPAGVRPRSVKKKKKSITSASNGKPIVSVPDSPLTRPAHAHGTASTQALESGLQALSIRAPSSCTLPVKVSREVCYMYDGVKTGITPVAGGCLCSTLRLVSQVHHLDSSASPYVSTPPALADYVNPALIHISPLRTPEPTAPVAAPPKWSELIVTVLGSECKTSRFTDTQAVASYAVRLLHHNELNSTSNA